MRRLVLVAYRYVARAMWCVIGLVNEFQDGDPVVCIAGGGRLMGGGGLDSWWASAAEG